MRQLTLAAVAACGPATAHPRTVTVQAPEHATWTSADVDSGSNEEHYHQSYTGGEGTIENVSVRLVVRHGQNSQSIELTDSMFGLERTAHEWALVRWELATTADGGWIGVTPDHGTTWVIVDPESLHACAAPAAWQRLPAPHDGVCPPR